MVWVSHNPSFLKHLLALTISVALRNGIRHQAVVGLTVGPTLVRVVLLGC